MFLNKVAVTDRYSVFLNIVTFSHSLSLILSLSLSLSLSLCLSYGNQDSASLSLSLSLCPYFALFVSLSVAEPGKGAEGAVDNAISEPDDAVERRAQLVRHRLCACVRVCGCLCVVCACVRACVRTRTRTRTRACVRAWLGAYDIAQERAVGVDFI